MPKESEPEKNPKIRPRGLFDRDKDPGKLRDPSKTEDEFREEMPAEKKLNWDNRPRQIGVKFQAKAVSKPLANPAGETDAKAPASATPLAQAPESAGPAAPPPPKTPRPEGGESLFIPPPAPDTQAVIPAEKKRNPRDLISSVRRKAGKRIRLVYALAAGLAVAAACSVASWNMGFGAGVQNSLDEATKEKATAPKEFLGELNQALADLRGGNTDKAEKKLLELEKTNPDVASLTYLLSMAAVQNGNIKLAEAKTAESIDKRERISDSLALQAVLETQKASDPSIEKFGDPRVRSETLLRQAMLADAANPFPMIELATLLRYQKRGDEALALLRGARSRLNPVDSHTVIDVTIGLSTLEDTPDSDLPQIADPVKDSISAFSAAYIAMRKGDFDQAAAILKTARKMTAPDLFDYLINDPAIRRYVSEPKLKEFFQ